MARLKGMRVHICECGTQIVGFPKATHTCSFCGVQVKIPMKPKGMKGVKGVKGVKRPARQTTATA